MFRGCTVLMVGVSCVSRYHVGTGGDDHTVDIWDIRRRGRIYTVPSHTNLVSHLKFQSKEREKGREGGREGREGRREIT